MTVHKFQAETIINWQINNICYYKDKQNQLAL